MNKWITAAIMAAVLLATTSECNQPGDKTPAKAPLPRVEIIMEVNANAVASVVHANVKVNAVDLSGRPVFDFPIGEAVRRLPYQHFYTQPATASARYSIEAIVVGVPGDIFGCKMFANGVELRGPGTPHVVEIPEGGQSNLVYCEYIYHGTGQ